VVKGVNEYRTARREWLEAQRPDKRVKERTNEKRKRGKSMIDISHSFLAFRKMKGMDVRVS